MKQLFLIITICSLAAIVFAQNVGIGTTTPGSKLQVTGGTEATYAPGSGYLLLGNANGRNLVFDNNEILARENGQPFDLRLQRHGGNVAIGTSLPHPSAKLDITSTTAGMLTPRMGTSQRLAINNPAKGLLVFDSTLNSFFYYDGGKWRGFYEQNYDASLQHYIDSAGTAVNLPNSTSGDIIYIPSTQNSGVIYDNGGPNGNYAANMNSLVVLPYNVARDSTVAFKIIVEEMNTEAGYDSLYIIGSVEGVEYDTIAVFTGSQTGTITATMPYTFFNFKSNHINQLPGFKIRWGRIKIPSQMGGNSIPDYGWYFDAGKMAARGGIQSGNNWHSDSIGIASISFGNGSQAKGNYATAFGYFSRASGFGSTAMGYGTTASGTYSTAIGTNTTASGYSSTAMGYATIASGTYSTAMGTNTTASGTSSSAMGYRTTASGTYSTAMGYNTTASGHYSTAMGRNTTATATATGSFAIGDSDPYSRGLRGSTQANEFFARFNGGYYLVSSNSAADIGVRLPGGGNAWVGFSSRKLKENFEPTNGEMVLQKLSNIPLGSWNYIGQDKKTFRHYGIMAQDFYEAFGKDSYGTIGNDTTVNPLDMQGISFTAIQALEKRTQKIEVLEKENASFEKENAALEKEIAALKQEMLQMRKELDIILQKSRK